MEGTKLYNVQFTRPINHIGRDAPEATLHSSGLWVIVENEKTGLVRMVPIDLIVSADLTETSKEGRSDRTVSKGSSQSPASRKAKAAAEGVGKANPV